MSLQKYCHYMNVLKISIHAHLHMLRCHCRHHHAAMEGGGQHRARVFFTANCPEKCVMRSWYRLVVKTVFFSGFILSYKLPFDRMMVLSKSSEMVKKH